MKVRKNSMMKEQQKQLRESGDLEAIWSSYRWSHPLTSPANQRQWSRKGDGDAFPQCNAANHWHFRPITESHTGAWHGKNSINKLGNLALYFSFFKPLFIQGVTLRASSHFQKSPVYWVKIRTIIGY